MNVQFKEVKSREHTVPATSNELRRSLSNINRCVIKPSLSLASLVEIQIAVHG